MQTHRVCALMARQSISVCLLLSAVACVAFTMHAGYKTSLAEEAEAAANNPCVVVEVPHPLETCDVVDEPYLHCRNGTFYDPSGSGDPRLRYMCAEAKYRPLRYDADGKAITYYSLRGLFRTTTAKAYRDKAGKQ